MLVACVSLLSVTTTYAAEPPAPAAPVASIVDKPALFTADDLLLLEVDADGWQLTDGLGAYSSRAGVFIPLGELARLMDIDLTVDPLRQRAEGWVVAKERTIRVDIPAHALTLGATQRALTDTEAAFKDGEIYVRTDVLEQILPIKVKLDKSSLTMTVTATTRLPFEERIELEKRKGMIGKGGEAAQPVMTVKTPYLLFTPPAVEVTASGDAGTAAPKAEGRYEIRAAGDLLYANLQAYAGSDEFGRPNDVRLLLERKDPAGKALGPLGVTQADLGDTFTRALPLGATTVGGRGLAITTAPLEQANVFDKTDLRGELPVGYTVELYVNEVLRGSQSQAVDGRYEFTNVELTFGLNVVRLVFYGPHGERREDVTRVNVGGGQVAKGHAVASLSAVQEATPLVSPTGAPVIVTAGQGQLRVMGDVAYGLTDKTTASLGFARFTPRLHDTRDMVTAGLSTSLAGFAAQLDLADDSKGGEALGVGLAGRWRGVSIVARERVYNGEFIDETDASSIASPLRLSSDLLLDTVAKFGSLKIPASLHFKRDDFADGSDTTSATFRLSQPIQRYLVSSTLTYQSTQPVTGPAVELTMGEFDVSGLVGGSWQMRGSLGYGLTPAVNLQSASVTASHQLSKLAAVQLSVQQTFGAGQSTVLQASNTWRLKPADLSFTGSYNTATRDFRIGFQATIGFGYDPTRNKYVSYGPGAAQGGSLAFRAFKDVKGNGVFQPGDPGMAGVAVQGGRQPVTTDAAGLALATGLGSGAKAQVHVSLEGLDDAYLISPPATVAFVPRPGRTIVVDYPMTTSGEVELRITFRRPGEAPAGLSALALQLVTPAGAVAAEGRTEYDGTLLLENLKPGQYAVRIEPAQAARLGMRLAAPIKVVVTGAGGFVGRLAGEAVLARPADETGAK